MASIIVTATGASQSAVVNLLNGLNASGVSSMILIAPERPAGTILTGQFLSCASASLGACLYEAALTSREEKLILLDASTEISSERMPAILASLAASKDDSFGYCRVETQEETLDLPELSIDSLVDFLTSENKLPLLCCSIPRVLLEGLGETSSTNLNETLALALVSAVTSGMPIVENNSTVRLSSRFSAETLRLSEPAIAAALRKVLELSNIEDLFPQHPWERHQGESAAASYHSLAAAFIRYGDLDSASQCLTLGDTFEDSPRSLALKGMIARERGELLGAVANMISSLQQYELRKRNETGEHYLVFKPLDLEIVNSSMRNGLSALNKRDNDAAVKCFTQAIINFDPFYKELGIDRMVD